MREAARLEYDALRRLGDPGANAAFLDQLETKLAAAAAPDDTHLIRANLLRRSGDLPGAREAISKHLAHTGEPTQMSSLGANLVIPPGLVTKPGNTIAPLIVIDDLLSGEDMASLHRHACDLEDTFRKATLSREGNPYDPDKRETLLTWKFDYKRQFFLDFVEETLPQFQADLGLPPFAVERSEIKLTNHLDGGFFNTHRDNLSGPNAAGRCLTWLYYFSATPPQFTGGELFIIDTHSAKEQCSQSFFTKVLPRPNRFVAFPSWFFHAVGPTNVPGNAFADGRFAVSGHISKGEDTAQWRGL